MISYLQIDKLTKSFGDLVLFEDITFGVAQGQKIGLIAKNGTGKTTLLNIIGGKTCGWGIWSNHLLIRKN